MKINIFSFVFLALSTSLFAQQETILVYDLTTGTLDSITNVTYDENITSDQTPYFIGNYNNEIESLPQTPPTSNTYPDTEYTLRKKVSNDFDITTYPIRTSVKLFRVENDTLRDNCSASMISRRHVLTLAHCVVSPNIDSVLVDSMLVCPIYNNSDFSPAFECSEVEKIYFFENRNAPGGSFAILELSDPVGEQTGWLSLGFNDSDDFFTEGIYFRFSYPSAPLFPLDSTEYNGDTLHYSYGKLDFIDDRFLGTSGTFGIPGEGGSSITLVENDATYTSYGVLMYAVDSKNSRIKNWQFYSIQAIIENDLLTNTISPQETTGLSLFPNPTTGSFFIENLTEADITEAFIADELGRIIKPLSKSELTSSIDISFLPNGTYHLFIKTKNDVFSEKIIKIGE